jgi:hypothetical protein
MQGTQGADSGDNSVSPITGERKRKLLPVISVGVTEGFSSLGYQLLIAGLILVGITVIAAVWAIADRREEVFTSYRRELANLGIVLAEQTARSIQAIDLVLQETRKEVLATGIADPDQFKRALATHELYRFLHGRVPADMFRRRSTGGAMMICWPEPTVCDTENANQETRPFLDRTAGAISGCARVSLRCPVDATDCTPKRPLKLAPAPWRRRTSATACGGYQRDQSAESRD